MARILRNRGDALVVTSLGNPTFDVDAAGDCAQNFYLWGAMGGALMVALGLAFAQPNKRVIAFLGDGELMMGPGLLATAAAEKPANLAVVVIDNEHHAETGMQPTHSGRGVDLVAVAAAVGFAPGRMVRTAAELDSAVDLLFNAVGPLLVAVKVSTAPTPTSPPPRDWPLLRSRFRDALLGADTHR